MPVTMSRMNLVKGIGPVLQIAEGWTAEIPADVHKMLDERTDKTWPTTWFVPRLTGKGPFSRCIFGDVQLGCQSWSIQLWTYRRRSDHPGFDASHSGLHA